MIKLKDTNIYVGTKEEIKQARKIGMNIVCALNRAPREPGIWTHQYVVGWTGRGCNKDNPYYLYKEYEDVIFLNMIDGDDPAYISDKMINAALNFMKEKLNEDKDVFIYCSLAESRSPSIAFMYLLENDIISKDMEFSEAITIFGKEYYPKYKPGMGNILYIKNRYFKKSEETK